MCLLLLMCYIAAEVAELKSNVQQKQKMDKPGREKERDIGGDLGEMRWLRRRTKENRKSIRDGAHLDSIQYSCVEQPDWQAASHSYLQTGNNKCLMSSEQIKQHTDTTWQLLRLNLHL